jgi:site-specific recombinase XerD
LAVTQLTNHCAKEGTSCEVTEVTPSDIRSYLGHVLEINSPATTKQRHNSLRQFWSWVVEEGLRDDNPMDGIRPPKVVEKPIELITEGQFKALLANCNDGEFNGRRDCAILQVFWDTGARLEEVTNLETHDVFLFEKAIKIREGKGGKSREARFTDPTQYALSRYDMLRKKHRDTDLDDLWLGKRGPLGRRGISQMITRRSNTLGFHTHPHAFRHSFADRWLSRGGSEGDLMRLMGWSKGSRGMLDRYGAMGQDRRALDAYERIYG